MIFLKDFNIDEAREILSSHNPEDLKIISHMEERWVVREFDINYIVNCLLNEIPLSISKTMPNRFKLIYPHRTRKTKDWYVIIEIGDDEIVSIITAYSEDKARRKHERKY